MLKVAGKNADSTEIATPIDLVRHFAMSMEAEFRLLELRRVGAADRLRRAGDDQHEGGNSQSAATIYAPNASFTLQGTAGSLRVRPGQDRQQTLATPSIHYDRRLASDFYVAGRPMVGSFTWKRY